MAEHQSPWLVRTAPRPHARVRLVCFPYGGGGASAFHRWHSLLPEWIELTAIQLPGRETRLREAPVRRLDALADMVCAELTPLIDRPYALFGHSMGALLAFELARRIQAAPLRRPSLVVLSARRAPHLAETHDQLHTLPDARFAVAMLRRYNGIPKAILQDAELLRLFLPTLRADMEVVETYRFEAGAPLDVPLLALGGDADPMVRQEDLQAWQVHSTQPLSASVFPGSHFYLQDQRAAVVTAIVAALVAALGMRIGAGPAATPSEEGSDGPENSGGETRSGERVSQDVHDFA